LDGLGRPLAAAFFAAGFFETFAAFFGAAFDFAFTLPFAGLAFFRVAISISSAS
jgi:hypothetical protein